MRIWLSEEPVDPNASFAKRLWHRLTGHNAAYVVLLGIFLVLAYAFFFRGLHFFLVPSSSMEPTLLRRDYIVTLREPAYHRGDIIVLYDPEEPGSYLVKRIVAVGGDQVQVIAGALFLNGKYVSEPYVKEPMQYTIQHPVLVPEGHVYYLGDNRNESDDSSLANTTVPQSDIIGRVRFLYYPLSRFGRVISYPLQMVSMKPSTL